jgi:predicted ester cyclase
MTSENEQLVRRFFDEFCNGRRAHVADEILDPDFVSHDPQTPAEGIPGVKASVGLYQDTVDGQWDVQELLSTGDRVVARWIGRGVHRQALMGVEPTGRPIAVEAISIFRIAGGRIVEEWTVWDVLGLLQQIGAFPAST